MTIHKKFVQMLLVLVISVPFFFSFHVVMTLQIVVQ